MHRSRLGIVSAVHQAPQAGMYQRSRAHGAGFQGSVHLALRQTMVAEGLGRLPQGHHLRVRRGVAVQQVAVEPPPHYLSFAHHYGSYRHLARLQRSLCLAQRFLHP
jgi:hypothetical protein